MNQIVEMHSRLHHFFIQGAVMLIIKTIAVENVDISDHFNDWKPESSKLVFIEMFISFHMALHYVYEFSRDVNFLSKA